MRRWAALVLALIIGGMISGCFGPVVRPNAEFTVCLQGDKGKLDYLFFDHSTTVPDHYITTQTWDFGDGTILSDCPWEMVVRCFLAEGPYDVNLTVTDDRGVSGTVTKEVLVQAPAVIREWHLSLGFPVQVTGEIVNRYTRDLEQVVVKAKFYNADGVRLTDGTVTVYDLTPGERALFTIKAQEYSSRIFSATVAIASFIADCPEKSTLSNPKAR